ncbi:MAG: FtsK/SpoIIIE domain-containing protein, partial [Thermoleophilia bacterium]|nr:FtsK/SpoIIIE domain-containing protein [Thermoleophilia bacterium]
MGGTGDEVVAAMEIHLRVEVALRDDCGRLATRHAGDVTVRVEPTHTVGELADAVADELGIDGRCGAAVSRPGAGTLDRASAVAEAGLVSGDVLVFGLVGSRPPARDGPLRLVVASGPDAGRSVAIGAGRHVVGRDPSCALVLDDPQTSRRHLAVTVGDGRTTIEVLAAGRNPVRIGGGPVVRSRPLRRGEIVRVGATTLVLRDPVRRRPPGRAFAQIPFHRAPYFPAPIRLVVIEPIAEIPYRPERSRLAYLSALLPLVMGAALALLLGNPRFLLFALFSPVMVIGNHLEQRRRTGRAFGLAVERFETELQDRADRVRRALAAERERRFAAAPDVAALGDRAASRAADLWARDRRADDFLHLRVGIGDLPAAIEARLPERGDAEYRRRAAEAYGDTTTVTDVPVTLDLAALGVVGLVGSTADTTALASSLLVQAACLHSPADLAIVAATAPHRHPAGWLAWLPHTRSGAPLAGPHVATTGTGAGALLAALVAECDRRLGPDVARHGPRPPSPSAPAAAGTAPPSRPPGSPGPCAAPRLLVLLDRALDPDPALVSRLLDAGPAAGLSVLWLSDDVATVPHQARTVIECRSPLTGRPSRIVATDPDVADRDIDLDRLGPEPAAATARALAPLRDASSVHAAGSIPEIAPLFATLGVEAIDADTVAERWAVGRGHSLRAAIGRTDSGPLVLDLVEHGPHALIGGTSGSGKSELLMSLVAGLIADNPPTRVNFLFIDYKGGASSDPFRRIPHAVGHVTNLDGLASLRALTSLRAELNRRMNLLQGRAKDLAEMRERFPEDAPPSLVIVVDEFATLVREIPDFVAGIVDVAQRGRSLGIHLILATQRPSGSVDENITANTNLRIALRMLDGSESRAVIGSPEAAAIPTSLRGRAYARLGAGEPVAFQSAWSGAPLPTEAGPAPVVATRFGTVASGVGPQPRAGPCGPAPVERTQIDALLDAVVRAAAHSGMGPGRAPWLDPLPAVIPLAQVRSGLVPAAGPGPRIAIGMVDDPEAQAQYPAVVDLGRTGGLLVAGTGGSGKSTLLVTAVVSAALDDADRGGGGLTVFAIDAASRALVGLRHLPQCAAVATADDLEALTRVIDVLDRELDRRRAARAEAVVGPGAAEQAPSILLLIDGLEAVLQVMEQGPAAVTLAPHQTRLTRLLTDGRQVGIHPVVATTRWPAVPAAVGSAIAGRLTLRQADAQGYAEAGLPAS